MKKIIFVFICLLLTACTATLPPSSTSAFAQEDSSSASSIASAPSASLLSVLESSASSGLPQDTAGKLYGAWEMVLEVENEVSKHYFSLTFGEDGSLEYIAGWYRSEVAERLVGTYTISADGSVVFDLTSTMAEEPYSMHTTLEYTVREDTLTLTLVDGDPMYYYQEKGVPDTYTRYEE